MERSPVAELRKLAEDAGLDLASSDFSTLMDERDVLTDLRSEFAWPETQDTTNASRNNAVYLAANKRGLSAMKAKDMILEVMSSWADTGVECHFNEPLPSASCEEYAVDQLLSLVGALNRDEVAAMNDVDVNLHLMLVSFYRPNANRHKILVYGEGGYLNIPKSHIEYHGHTKEESLLYPSAENENIGTEVFLEVIESEGESISCILLPSVLPNNGYLLDMEKISRKGHEKGCMVGFIISDAVGVVELQLHKWQVDFACWDTGKYLGAGPSACGCAFLHSKHATHDYPILTGWWGHRLSSRFEMTNDLDRSPGISGYKISNESPIKIAQLKAALNIYDKTSIKAIRKKSILLIGYLEYLFEKRLDNQHLMHDKIIVLTPKRSSERAAQISFKLPGYAQRMCDRLAENGMFCSTLSPDILTVCVHPLYCGFNDIFRFASLFATLMQE